MLSQQTLFHTGKFHKLDDSDQRYTPKKYLDLVLEVLGDIDLDPTADPSKRVPAKWHITEMDNCLTTDWIEHCGGELAVTIFMNPPYSNAHPFIQRLCEYLDENPEVTAITLTHSSLIQTAGSQKYFRHYSRGICLPNQRINFDYPPMLKPKSGNDRDSLWTYWGDTSLLNKFHRVFSSQGLIY